ncbi:MAG: IgGFc-binding protein [Deltaproteobacteria bacterium]|nr:IgGFc-binding protein [Deltaproteobacteria bacterium]
MPRALHILTTWGAAGLLGHACAQPAASNDTASGGGGFADLGGLGTGDAVAAADGQVKADAVNDVGDVAVADAVSCPEGASRCTGDVRETCTKGAWTVAACPTKSPVCLNGVCVTCLPGKKRCAAPATGSSASTKVEQCATTGLGWVSVETCPAGGLCLDAACAPCKPGSHRCAKGQRETCDAAAKAWVADPCPSDQPICDKGTCFACPPGQPFCAEPEPGQVTSTIVLQCDAAGANAEPLETCAPPKACYSGACRICNPGETRCTTKGQLESCADDGQSWSVADCPETTPACAKGSCMLCLPDTLLCGPAGPDGSASTKVLKCNPTGGKASVVEVCTGSLVCAGAKCAVCAPKAQTCLADVLLTCAAEGGNWATANSCAAVHLPCLQGLCACAPGQTLCAPPALGTPDSHKVATCNAAGDQAAVTQVCPDDGVCDNGACLPCKPTAVRCQGTKALQCKPDGSGWQVLEDCAAKGQFCAGGGCRDLCDPDQPNATHLGCSFFAASLDNATAPDPTQELQFALTLHNPAPAKTAKVQLSWTDANGATKTKAVEVGAKASTTVQIPPAEWGPTALKLEGSGLAHKAIAVQSDLAIGVIQHLPGNPAVLPSTGAATLLPANGLGTAYRAVTLPQTALDEPAFVAVVSAAKGLTKVTVTPSDKVVAGPGTAAIKAGVATTFALEQGQVLHMATAAVGADLTGTLVEADKPVAVFSGNRSVHAPVSTVCQFAAFSPAGAAGKCKVTGAPCLADVDCGQVCCADHTGEQVPPLNSWGTVVVVPALQLRDPASKEMDLLRVVASADQTTIATVPQIGPPVTLAAGQYVDFETKADVVVVASKPVLVAQSMTSAQTMQAAGNDQGDPTLQIVPPVQRYSALVPFAVPAGYGSTWVNVAFRSGSAAHLDGSALGAGTPIPGSGWSVVRKPVGAGAHALDGVWPVGGSVYGWIKGAAFGTCAGSGLP